MVFELTNDNVKTTKPSGLKSILETGAGLAAPQFTGAKILTKGPKKKTEEEESGGGGGAGGMLGGLMGGGEGGGGMGGMMGGMM